MPKRHVHGLFDLDINLINVGILQLFTFLV